MKPSDYFKNGKKTKDLKICKGTDQIDNTHITINNLPVEKVTEFTYLRDVFTSNYDDSKEIRNRIESMKHTRIALFNIWKNRQNMTVLKKLYL